MRARHGFAVGRYHGPERESVGLTLPDTRAAGTVEYIELKHLELAPNKRRDIDSEAIQTLAAGSRHRGLPEARTSRHVAPAVERTAGC